MPALKNQKHEAYCQAYVKGETAGNMVRCYAHAYGADAKLSHVRSAASRLNQREDILNRIAELQKQGEMIENEAVKIAAEKLSITKEGILAKLAENVERAMQTTAVLDHEGEPTGEYKYDGAVANRALELLGKTLGLFVDRKHVTHDHADKSDDELRRSAAAIVSELAKLGVSLPTLAGVGDGDERTTETPRRH